MHRRRPRHQPFLPLVAVLVGGIPWLASSAAEAACTLSACDASALTGNAACCSASSCTIDGVLTVSGPTCTFDFGTRNVTVSGQVAAQGKTITITGKSLKLTGLIDVRGPNGADAGNVTIVTTGMTPLAFSQEGGTSAVIDASSTTGAGGTVTIQADGGVSLAKGTVTANGGTTGSAGLITITTSAGSIGIQNTVTASSAATALSAHGQIIVSSPGDFTLGGSGRLLSDLGEVDVDAAGTATFADGSVVQANGEDGAISVIVGALTAKGEFRAADEGGNIELEAITGPMLLQRLSQGITVGPGVQALSITTDATGADGLLTMDMPIVATGAEVEISSGGALVVSRKIQTTGLLDSGAGDVTLSATDDLTLSTTIAASDVATEASISIDGRNVTISGSINANGGGTASGGSIDISAAGSVTLTGDIVLAVSGFDAEPAGSISIQAGGDLTIGSSVELFANGGTGAPAGPVTLYAGEGFGEKLPGNLLMQGDIAANGHSTGFSGGLASIFGCTVTIPSGAVIDVTGDPQSTVQIVARTGVTVAGTVKSTVANVVEFPVGGAVSLTGSFTPARSAGACTGGTPTSNGCQRDVCTADATPPGCLVPCPACGDDVVQYPETCEIGSGGPFCSGDTLCDARCRANTCPNAGPCVTPVCDPVAGACSYVAKPDGTECDGDANVCTGVGTCGGGTCHLTPGSALDCNDANPCTLDACDKATGCGHTPITSATPTVGCDDGQLCNGIERCNAGSCTSSPACPGQMCDPATQQCEPFASCTTPADCADDGNPCTSTTCTAGTCGVAPALPGTDCDDGNLCNGVRTCDGSGVCQAPSAPVSCDDGDLCTTDACNPATGTCTHTGLAGCCTTDGDCGDGDACTTDTCDVDTATCVHGVVTCDDFDPCTADACSAQTGCTTTPIANCQPCDDVSTCPTPADPKNDAACLGGRCVEVPSPNYCATDADCTDIDNNPCTNNGPCSGNRCAGPFPQTGPACGTTCNPGTCQSGVCQPGTPPDCSDGNPCTTDLCTDDQGCIHQPIALCCFGVADCNDANVCTTDGCDLDANRCTHLVADETCTPCVGSDPFECGPRCSTTCQGGQCVDLAPSCDDENPCTADSCDAATGCAHTPIDGTGIAGCDDGQVCNGAERCVAGTCQQQSTPACDDDDACTTDTCTDAGGCAHAMQPGLPGVACAVDRMTADLDGASLNAKLRKKLEAKLKAIRGKVAKAQTPSLKCRKAKALLGGARGRLRAFQTSVNRMAGRQLDSALATSLAVRAGDAASTCDAARAALGC